jgi:hypothetical protein
MKKHTLPYRKAEANEESIISVINQMIEDYKDDINLSDFNVRTGFMDDDVITDKISVTITYFK